MTNEPQILSQLLKNTEMLGALDAKVDVLTEEVKQIHRYERRLGRVESDVKGMRRIFGGLFTLFLAAEVAAVNWLKG